jgi:tetratricopeptide (TPR) repeat protein
MFLLHLHCVGSAAAVRATSKNAVLFIISNNPLIMKTKFNLSIMVLALLSFVMPRASMAQDAEKQKVIDVINLELTSHYNKDYAKWADCWVHSSKLSITVAGASFIYNVEGWDSLNAQRAKWFRAPVDPKQVRSTKSDFNVTISGTIAMVDVKHNEQEYVLRQNIVLEKQGKAWKILKITAFNKGSYEATPVNIEAAINWQGYQLLKLNKVDEAIRVFFVNTELFPAAFNTWDSLAEGYMVKGEKDIAIGYYKKSIELNPKNENGKKMLERLSQAQASSK